MQSIKIAFLLLACTTLAMAGSAKSSLHGEISDSQCAMNVHALKRTHEEMIKKNTLGSDPASCARACARRGGEWVLRSGDEIYRLKNQTGIDEYAGQKVLISGSLDLKTHTIDNAGIRAESPKGVGPK